MESVYDIITTLSSNPLTVTAWIGVILKLVINGFNKRIRDLTAAVERIEGNLHEINVNLVNHAERISRIEGMTTITTNKGEMR